jgi:nucleotide-binding universal stress UspA family protein
MRPSSDRNLRLGEVSSRPLDRIVVGVDFTESSLAVAQWVGRYLSGAALTLVHVIAPPPMPNAFRRHATPARTPDGAVRSRVRSLTGALRGLAGVIGGGRVHVEVRVGDPGPELNAYAAAVDADLLVVGGNAVFRGAPRVDARATERVLRGLTRPLLIARTVQSRPTTVLAAVSDDTTAPVLTMARLVGTACGARVEVLRLVDGEHERMILDAARDLRAEIIAIGKPVSEDGDDAARMLARTASCSVLVVPNAAEPPYRGSWRRNVLGAFGTPAAA